MLLFPLRKKRATRARGYGPSLMQTDILNGFSERLARQRYDFLNIPRSRTHKLNDMLLPGLTFKFPLSLLSVRRQKGLSFNVTRIIKPKSLMLNRAHRGRSTNHRVESKTRLVSRAMCSGLVSSSRNSSLNCLKIRCNLFKKTNYASWRTLLDS